jgi:Flp pilus assembly protein TadG
MKPQVFAALFILLLCVYSYEVDAWRGHHAKRKHMTPAAKQLARQAAKQLGKAQGRGKAAKVTSASTTSSMSYSAAVAFCTDKLKAAGDKGEVGWAGWASARAVLLLLSACCRTPTCHVAMRQAALAAVETP